jgi:putative transposase
MSRLRRSFEAATSYHVTLRCNNQAFDLRRPQARKVILFCLARAKEKFAFDLFGLCVMSNHVHYLIRPARPEEMPRLMHWLNWYSAMLLNRLLRRRGHFWERRYHAVAVPDRDSGHALRVLRYIHAKPKAAGMIAGYDFAYSNYRSYTRPADDGLSAWHPAYLRLGATLDGCARRYEQFCRRYRPEAKEQRRSRWGAGSCGARSRVARRGPAARPTFLVHQVPGIAGGRDGHGGHCRWSSCGPACWTRSSGFVRVNQPSGGGRNGHTNFPSRASLRGKARADLSKAIEAR